MYWKAYQRLLKAAETEEERQELKKAYEAGVLDRLARIRANDNRAQKLSDPNPALEFLSKLKAKPKPKVPPIPVPWERTMCDRARKRAHEKELNFDLTPAYVRILRVPRCPILGLPLHYGGGNGWQPNSASIDRVDNNLGYIRGNVHIISSRANTLKSNCTIEQLRDRVRDIEAVIDYLRVITMS